MISLNWVSKLADSFMFYGGGDGGGGSSKSTSQATIDPTLQPYVKYGLQEAQKLYKTPGPGYYPGQTYVNPSEATQSALGLTQQRALAGSPLLRSAQEQQLATIQGRGVNPFLSKALEAAYQPTIEAAQEATRGLQGSASQAGRYGSDAMAQIAERQAAALGRGLGGQLSNLAYQSAESEAARQAAAIAGAPAMSQADYADLAQLANVGQTQEQYSQQALQDKINRYNYEQNLPYQKLSQYAGLIYGAPQGSSTTTTQSSSGGGKIVCTMMNESYGIGSFRNRVWLAHSASMPNAKTYEKGYHTLFLPLVAFAKNDGIINRAVKRVLEHIAKHRTADIYKSMRGKKRDVLGMIYRAILEPICYVVGKVKGY